MTEDGNKKKMTGFQSLKLSPPLFKGVMAMGYKQPTPVQRKTLPIALSGKDVVCMARTGSGKTCAFLIPMFEKLQSHSTRTGVRGLILTPTRELCLQTLRFIKQMGKYTDLRAAVLVGGDSMDQQFEALSNNPDILIATPGRLMHHLQEIADFSLKGVQYVVFDEADRLFEMGFAEQLHETLKSLPDERQTLLFSATLPKLLVQFARAGLRDPELIRLDVETRISDTLRLAFFTLRADLKPGALMYLLEKIIPKDQMTIIFGATRQQLEFLYELLQHKNLDATIIYGSMDQEARTSHLDNFRLGKVSLLLVTDIAARGIDIPILDNVINYSFASSPKVFVHRVGRAGRQGRIGTVFNLVEPEEMPYMIDLYKFLGRKMENIYIPENEQKETNVSTENEVTIQTINEKETHKKADKNKFYGYTWTEMTPEKIHFGSIPQHILDFESEQLNELYKNDSNFPPLIRMSENSMMQYRKNRMSASKTAVHKAKNMNIIQVHPLLIGTDYQSAIGNEAQISHTEFMKQLQIFRPYQTILEIKREKDGIKLSTNEVMRDIRRLHQPLLKKLKETDDDNYNNIISTQDELLETFNSEENNLELVNNSSPQENSKKKKQLSKNERKKLKKANKEGNKEEIENILHESNNQSKKRKREFKDLDNYISYGKENDRIVEAAMQGKNLENDEIFGKNHLLEDAIVDFDPDEAADIMKKKKVMQWDPKKRKYIQVTLGDYFGTSRGVKKVKTESGKVVSKKKLAPGELYKKWKKESHREIALFGQEEGESVRQKGKKIQIFSGRGQSKTQVINADVPDELRNAEQIRKLRERKEDNKLKATKGGMKEVIKRRREKRKEKREDNVVRKGRVRMIVKV